MNVITSVMLLHRTCSQRGVRFHFDMCVPWIESLAACNLRGILFVSGVDAAEQQKRFPHMEIIQAETYYPNWAELAAWNACIARFALYNYWLPRAPNVDAVFFNDATDVLVKQDPFLHIEDNTLYCGDEPNTVEHGWMQWQIRVANNPEITDFFTAHPALPLVNPGICGGRREVVRALLAALFDAGLHNSENGLDMLFFNYVVHASKLTVRIQHGEPVNSVFNAYQQNRTDVWFVHK